MLGQERLWAVFWLLLLLLFLLFLVWFGVLKRGEIAVYLQVSTWVEMTQ